MRLEFADQADQRGRRLGQRDEAEAALGQRRQRVPLGQAGVDEAEEALLDAEDLPGPAISARLMLGRSASTSGRSMALLSTLPRSPPVIVATRTSTPSLTYRAIVAAPLLDSSSGCACTAKRRSFASAA